MLLPAVVKHLPKGLAAPSSITSSQRKQQHPTETQLRSSSILRLNVNKLGGITACGVAISCVTMIHNSLRGRRSDPLRGKGFPFGFAVKNCYRAA